MAIKKFESDESLYDYNEELSELDEKYGGNFSNIATKAIKKKENKDKTCKFHKNSYDNYRK